jgi:TonB family protein
VATSDPDEIAIPRKKTAVSKKTPKDTATANAKSATDTKVATKTKKAGGTSSVENADEIRRRFASALKAAGDGEGGTAYGDGKVAGGGTGKSNHLGSPDGSPDGVPGGVGQGTPFWKYFQGVHDQMYEAWEQPGSALDKKLIATVMIKVARDGSITDVELQRSSGNKLMDDSAVTAARKVLHLEPPPDSLVRGSTADITVDFQVEG